MDLVKQENYSRSKHFPWLIPKLAFVLLNVIAAGIWIPRMEFGSNLDNWIPENSPESLAYKTFLERFRSDAALILSFESSADVPDSLRSIGIDNCIFKIADLPQISGMSKWPLPALRHKRAPRAGIDAFILYFEPPSHIDPNRLGLIREIKEISATALVAYHLAGTGVLLEAIESEGRILLTRYLSICMIILLLVLSIAIRNIWIVLKVFAVSVGGVSILLTSTAALGYPFYLVHSVLPILILFYGTSSALHILFHARQVRGILIPCTLASLTTAIGFSVFFLDSIPLLRQFSVMALSGLAGSLI